MIAALAAAALAAVAAPAPSNGIEVVSVGPGGKQTYGGVFTPVLSGDGRRVFFGGGFSPELGPLPPGGLDLGSALYVRDRSAGSTRIVSVGAGNVVPEGLAGAEEPSVSDDGRFAVFQSLSTRLACLFGACGQGQLWRTYIRDVEAGTLRPLLLDEHGLPAMSDKAAISGDGRFVALREFDSSQSGVTVVDRVSGHAQRIRLVGSDPVQFQFTKDGASLAYSTDVEDIFDQHCFLLDRSTGVSTRLDATAGTPANGSTCQAGISNDGSRVAFISNATNLGGATDGKTHLYVRDLPAGRAERHDYGLDGRPIAFVTETAGGGSGTSPALSGDGRFVAFASENALYVRDIAARSTQRVDVATNCGAPDLDPESDVVISDDGRYIAFISRAVNLVTRDVNGHNADVFVRDRLATCTRKVAPSGPLIQAIGLSARVTTSASFGTVEVRFALSRVGDVTVVVEQRRAGAWRRAAERALSRLAPRPWQLPMSSLLHGWSPPAGTYRIVVSAGKTTVRLPLVVR